MLAGLSLSTVRERVGGRSNTPRIQSLAVLPLVNLSSDPDQDYFADGMTDALTTDLGKISALRVISRTSAMQYKNYKEALARDRAGTECGRACRGNRREIRQPSTDHRESCSGLPRKTPLGREL